MELRAFVLHKENIEDVSPFKVVPDKDGLTVVIECASGRISLEVWRDEFGKDMLRLDKLYPATDHQDYDEIVSVLYEPVRPGDFPVDQSIIDLARSLDGYALSTLELISERHAHHVPNAPEEVETLIRYGLIVTGKIILGDQQYILTEKGQQVLSVDARNAIEK